MSLPGQARCQVQPGATTVCFVTSSDHAPSQPDRPVQVLVYSSNRVVRQQILTALGLRPDPDGPTVAYTEVATQPALLANVDGKKFDLVILDGEASPAGGLGMSRQLKDEIYQCPPILVVVGRAQDAWLATWSRADAVVSHPINAMALASQVNALLATRRALSA